MGRWSLGEAKPIALLPPTLRASSVTSTKGQMCDGLAGLPGAITHLQRLCLQTLGFFILCAEFWPEECRVEIV